MRTIGQQLYRYRKMVEAKSGYYFFAQADVLDMLDQIEASYYEEVLIEEEDE